MEWIKYPSLERTEQLRGSGREMLGRILMWTEKRDGSNISVWLNPDTEIGGKELDLVTIGSQEYKVMISSRNQIVASGTFANILRDTKEYNKVVEYLKEFPQHVVFGELISPGYTPTRVEPVHKRGSYHVFDIYDREFMTTGGRFLGYNNMYQQMYHFKVPTVTLLGITRHTKLLHTEEELEQLRTVKSVDMDSLFTINSRYKSAVIDGVEIDEMVNANDSYYFVKDLLLKWSRRHRREGVVIKTFGDENDPIYVKEKVDLPSRPKLNSVNRGQNIHLPPLPESEVYGAINKVHVDIGTEKFRDKVIAMPLIVKYVGEECTKHVCDAPQGKLFEYYLTALRGLEQVPNVR